MAEVAAGSAKQRLAGALLDEVETLAERSVARMQEALPSYARVAADDLTPVTLAHTRNLLETVCEPDPDQRGAENRFRPSGETRLTQEIPADEMLQAWRIALEVVHEETHSIAKRLGVRDAKLLEFCGGDS
ncbi:MAG TPA: hypothetical protein VMB27_26095 [Solirubrobacteraceae bacterium]|nr:hypothetical protein [Solirubrobacteraceae bacterium]